MPSRPPRIRAASLRWFGAVLSVVAELAVRHLRQHANDLDAHRVTDRDLDLAPLGVVEGQGPMRHDSFGSRLRRGDGDSDDRRRQHPEHPLRQSRRLRLPLHLGDIRPMRLGLREGVHHVLGIGFGAEVAGKGARNTSTFATGKVNPIYMQVPVQFTFRTGGLFVGLGPFISVGIGGSNETNGKKADISFGPEIFRDYSAIDYGAGLELGYEFGSLRAFISYSKGYANIVPKAQADLYKISARSSVIGFGLAYIF